MKNFCSLGNNKFLSSRKKADCNHWQSFTTRGRTIQTFLAIPNDTSTRVDVSLQMLQKIGSSFSSMRNPDPLSATLFCTL
jgi:hypothetical protein